MYLQKLFYIACFAGFYFVLPTVANAQGCSSPRVYWRDADGDGRGTDSFRTDDISLAERYYIGSPTKYGRKKLSDIDY